MTAITVASPSGVPGSTSASDRTKARASCSAFSPSFLGKSTTAVQLIYVTLVLVMVVVRGSTVSLFPILLATIGLTILSGLHYIYRGIRHLNSEQT